MSPNANSPSVRAPVVGVEARRAGTSSPLVGLGLDAAPGLEAQARALDALAAPGRGHRERHDALGRVLVRAREDLAVGQVVAAGGADPATAADAQAQVGAVRHDAQLVDASRAARPAGPAARPAARQATTGSGWSSLSARAEQVAVAVEREAGGLSVGGGRVLRAAPHRLAAGVALEQHVHRAQARPSPRPRRAPASTCASCSTLASASSVTRQSTRSYQTSLSGSASPSTSSAAHSALASIQPSGSSCTRRVRAGLEHAAMHGARQRLGGLARLDQHALAGAHRERVLDDHARVEVVERIHQTTSLPSQQQGLAVGVDAAARAQVADQVPVDRRHVVAAEQREGAAEREVARAADLLVEERCRRRRAGSCSFVPIANSPTRRAPSSVSRRASRASSPSAADASTTTPASKRRRTSRHARPSCSEGTPNRISPSTPPCGGRRRPRRRAGSAEPAHDSQARPCDVHAQVGAGCRDVQLAHAREPVDQPLRDARPARARRQPGRARRAAAPSRRSAPRPPCPCARSARRAPSG